FIIFVDQLYLHSFPTRRSSDLFEIAQDQLQSGKFWIGIVLQRKCQIEPLTLIERSPLLALRHAPTQRVEEISIIADAQLQMFFRSEEHTSELQSPYDLVCRLLL